MLGDIREFLRTFSKPAEQPDAKVVQRFLQYTIDRLWAAIAEVEKLKASDFAYADAPRALNLIGAEFVRHRENVEKSRDRIAGAEGITSERVLVLASQCKESLDFVSNVL